MVELVFNFHSAKSHEDKHPQSLATSATVFESGFKMMKSEVTRQGIYLMVKPEETRKIIKTKPEHLSISLPTPDGLEMWQLDLTINDLLSPDFAVKTLDGSYISREKLTEQAIWYHGTIAGKEKSIAALSFYEGEIIGVLNDGNYNYDLLKNKGGKSGEHAIVEASKIMKNMPFTYSTEDSHKHDKHFEKSVSPSCRKVITIYLKCDHRMFIGFGNNTTNTANYITGVFNVVAQLYSNLQACGNLSWG